MNIERLREFCLSFPHATEEIKWGNDLCFCVGGKMFAVTGVDSSGGGISLKCSPEKFTELVEIDGIVPAPYVARYHWIAVRRLDTLHQTEIKHLISESYRLVFDKLPGKVKKSLS